jgi:hypothetical protein
VRLFCGDMLRHHFTAAAGGRYLRCWPSTVLGVWFAPVLAGNSFTYQITLSTTDLLLHSSFDPKGKMSPMDVMHTQFSKIMVRHSQHLWLCTSSWLARRTERCVRCLMCPVAHSARRHPAFTCSALLPHLAL